MQATHAERAFGDRRRGDRRRTTATAASIAQGMRLLHATFIVLPVVAGLDKFAELLTNWPKYLSPAMQSIVPLSPQAFMYAVGIVEIFAGISVAVRPRVGGLIVGAWLCLIALNLVLHPAGYFDIALRDLGLAFAAFACARLSNPPRATDPEEDD